MIRRPVQSSVEVETNSAAYDLCHNTMEASSSYITQLLRPIKADDTRSYRSENRDPKLYAFLVQTP
jgi:hypothetical protein